jgi:hypothetical protein
MFHDDVLKFIHKSGPHGDCTTYYYVEFPEGWTVEDFMRYIVYNYAASHNEFGNFEINDHRFIEYSCRKGDLPSARLHNGAWLFYGNKREEEKKEEYLNTSREIYNTYIHRKLKRVIAGMGWGRSDYHLEVEDDE